jgi:hypothetical protein
MSSHARHRASGHDDAEQAGDAPSDDPGDLHAPDDRELSRVVEHGESGRRPGDG